ncbi:hypothetical protein [Methylophilus sp.]|uniref:hypothetical protein n=1 Tax=Methylophilus sp. TaxID=29541 RepID=UPI0011D67EEC|nr:hypothetical protein [Methylophilus sp.]TXI46044.1 MAG: hypothetical protein E6Q52_04565 [Methylophilus sp.]
MTERTKMEIEYLAAMQRLLDRKETISLNAIAIEAGKKAGSLRAARYPEILKEINRIIEVQEANLIQHTAPKFEEKIRQKDDELQSLKQDYAITVQKVISLERQVFKLQAELAGYRKDNHSVISFQKPRK